MAWNKLKARPDLLQTAEGQKVRDIARQQILEHIRIDDALEIIDRKLGGLEVDCVLFKGRALSRHYDPQHIRPCGDIDLLVAPDSKSEVLEAMNPVLTSWHEEPEEEISGFLDQPQHPGIGARIDLHTSLERFRMPHSEEILGAAQTAGELGLDNIRMPTPEHHLRLVAIHFLRHGGWRPLWLCDVAAMVESAGGEFDWDVCLGQDPRTREWVSATIGLSRELLDTDVSGVPVEIDLGVPTWLKTCVLREWSKSDPNRFVHSRISDTLTWPAWFWSELKKRWPNPLIATTRLNTSMTGSPRWCLQAWHLGGTIVRYAGRSGSRAYHR